MRLILVYRRFNEHLSPSPHGPWLSNRLVVVEKLWFCAHISCDELWSHSNNQIEWIINAAIGFSFESQNPVSRLQIHLFQRNIYVECFAYLISLTRGDCVGNSGKVTSTAFAASIQRILRWRCKWRSTLARQITRSRMRFAIAANVTGSINWIILFRRVLLLFARWANERWIVLVVLGSFFVYGIFNAAVFSKFTRKIICNNYYWQCLCARH